MITTTIDELIFLLAELKKEGLDKVILSSDPEGNSYGTIDPKFSIGAHENILILYPTEQFLDLEEVSDAS